MATVMNEGSKMMDKKMEWGMEMEESMMGLEKIKKEFKEDLPDEIHDANKYLNMADAAKMMGDDRLAHGLYEVAHDEYTHAKFIHDYLVDWGCEIPEEQMMRWHELKERVRRKFRRN